MLMSYAVTSIMVCVSAAVVSAQTPDRTFAPTTDPCQHPVVIKARTEGLNALTFLEIPRFVYLSWSCQRTAKKEGRQVDFGDLYREKWAENYDKSQEISGLGATVLTVSVLILVYSLVSFTP